MNRIPNRAQCNGARFRNRKMPVVNKLGFGSMQSFSVLIDQILLDGISQIRNASKFTANGRDVTARFVFVSSRTANTSTTKYKSSTVQEPVGPA